MLGGEVMVRSRPKKGRKLAKFRNGWKIAQKWMEEKCVMCKDGLVLE
jgi:hypothetical protein